MEWDVELWDLGSIEDIFYEKYPHVGEGEFISFMGLLMEEDNVDVALRKYKNLVA